jgi:hypothetical protein
MIEVNMSKYRALFYFSNMYRVLLIVHLNPQLLLLATAFIISGYNRMLIIFWESRIIPSSEARGLVGI